MPSEPTTPEAPISETATDAPVASDSIASDPTSADAPLVVAIVMKRPNVNKELPDKNPLLDAMAAIDEAHGKINALRAEKVQIEKEIADYIATQNEPDQVVLQQIAGLEVRLRMLPNIEGRLLGELDEKNEALFPLIDAFADMLEQRRKREMEAWHDIAEAHILPFVPHYPDRNGRTVNRARHLVRLFPWNTVVPNLFQRLVNLKKPSAADRTQALRLTPHELIAGRKSEQVTQARQNANILLSFHGKIDQAGRFYHYPEDVAAVEKAALDAAIEAEKRHERETQEAKERREAQVREEQVRFNREKAEAEKNAPKHYVGIM